MLSHQRFSFLVFSLIFIIPAAGWAADEELFNLRGPAPEKGQIYLLTAKSNGKDMTRKRKGPNGTTTRRFDEIGTVKKEFEVLAVQDGEISRLRTRVIEDRREQIMHGLKKELRKSRDRELSGQIIYSERTKNGWKNFLEDAKPDDEQKRALKDFSPYKEDDLMLPAGKVKVGHEWKIDKIAFDRIFGHQFEKLNASGTGKFPRFEKINGEELAVIEIEFTLTGSYKEEDVVTDVEFKTKNVAYRSLKTGVDRKSTQETRLTMKSVDDDEGVKQETEFSGVITADEAVELKLKK